MSLFDEVHFDSRGLVPVIVQDAENSAVLMMAWMNAEALKITIERKQACYFSRSRGKLWLKGETSGNFQNVEEIRLDCDGDTILLKVEQKGGACHLGYRSCFHRKLQGDAFIVDSEKVFDPTAVYNNKKPS